VILGPNKDTGKFQVELKYVHYLKKEDGEMTEPGEGENIAEALHNCNYAFQEKYKEYALHTTDKAEMYNN
jgi:hypothetical protein